MLSHSINRFYVVPKFILSTIVYIAIKPITFDMEYSYFNVHLEKGTHAV